jgi:hypothetical protein
MMYPRDLHTEYQFVLMLCSIPVNDLSNIPVNDLSNICLISVLSVVSPE